MSGDEVTRTAASLLIEFGDVGSARRAAGARAQTACNTSERQFWGAVRLVLAAAEDQATVGNHPSSPEG